MTQNYFITLATGILDQKHQEKMQVNSQTTAIWMYLWLLDKMTSVEKDTGNGKVLYGKPMKLEEIPIFKNIKTTRKVIHVLVREGYLITKRTPYGHVIWITKAKKIFGQKVIPDDRELPQDGRSEKKRTTTRRQVTKDKDNQKVALGGRSESEKVALGGRSESEKVALGGRSNNNNTIITIHINNTYTYYKEKINKSSKLLDKAKEKIIARLKVYSPDDLKKAIDNFSADAWWMKNNAHRGVAWFFHSDERIEQLMNMRPRAVINQNIINQPQVDEDKYKDL